MVSLSEIAMQIYSQPNYKQSFNYAENCTNQLVVDKVLEILDSNENICKELNVLFNGVNKKSSSKGETFKDSGNKLFQAQKYKEALGHYSEGILHTPRENQELLGTLFANRSAGHLHCYNYTEALSDIQASLSRGYPEKLSYKVLHRAGLCYLKLKKYDEAAGYFQRSATALALSQLDDNGKLKWKAMLEKEMQKVGTRSKSFDGNNESDRESFDCVECSSVDLYSLPCQHRVFKSLASSLEVTSSDAFGRFVVASESITCGDTLAIEQPFCSVLLPDCYKTQCLNCHCKVSCPYPCRQCPNIVYCSLKCEETDWDMYHQYECCYMHYFGSSVCSRVGHLATRIFMFMGCYIVKEYVESSNSDDKTGEILQETMKENMSQTKTESLQHKYSAFLALVNNEGKRDPETSLHLALLAILLKNIIYRSGAIENYLKSYSSQYLVGKEVCITPEEMEHFVVKRLLKHLQIIQCNSFAITEMKNSKDLRQSKPGDVALAVYLQCSFFNHSCDPDIEFSFHGNTIVAHATRDVVKGDQVYCDYGYVFHSNRRSKRQSELKSQYLFECRCVACKKDWPLFDQMESKVPTFKCHRCSCPLDISNQVDRTCVPCTNPCCDPVNLVTVLEDLTKSHTYYTEGMEQAEAGRYNQAIPLLTEHLRYMDKYLCKPWREYYSCQAALKQCFRLSGNTDQALK